MKIVHRKLKKAFVTSYFMPLSELGVEIADLDRFIELIPDEDIAPYVDRLQSKTVELYLSVYTPEQLASIASVLRADNDATLDAILSGEYQQRHLAALEQARANAQPSGSNDPHVLGLEELSVQVNALATTLKDVGGEAVGQSMALGLAPIFALMEYTREIEQIEQKPDNHVTIAALRADGILRFANFVQQKNLLRQLSASESTGGIQFKTPPARNTQSN